MNANPLDVAALEAAGKKQVIRREWGFWAVFGLSACALCTWEALSALFITTFFNGGPASAVYGFFAAIVGAMAVAASLAEMASISPIAGAQYHWSAEHAPLKWRAFLSWVQGWVTIVGWVTSCGSLAFISASIIQALVIFNNPTYDSKRWHATLIMIALASLAALTNIFLKRLLPLIEALAGLSHVVFFFILMIVLLVTSEKAPSKNVWATFVNEGGWPNDGVSFCIGFLTPAVALAGVDGVVHLSEETKSSNKNIPKAMMYSLLANAVAGFAFLLTILYSINDLDAIFATPTGFPIFVVFQQATRSTKAATAMMCAILTIFIFSLVGGMLSASRLIWAFARDNGLPFSSFFKQISAWNINPNNCVIAVLICVCLLSLINIGSSTAFNALVSLSTLGLYFSYIIPITIFAFRRYNRSRPISFGPWSLGRFGLSINILAVAYCIFIIIFLPFPPALPVNGVNMNYAAPVFIAVMLFAIIDFFIRSKRRFTGPIREITPGENTLAMLEQKNMTHPHKA